MLALVSFNSPPSFFLFSLQCDVFHPWHFVFQIAHPFIHSMKAFNDEGRKAVSANKLASWKLASLIPLVALIPLISSQDFAVKCWYDQTELQTLACEKLIDDCRWLVFCQSTSEPISSYYVTPRCLLESREAGDSYLFACGGQGCSLRAAESPPGWRWTISVGRCRGGVVLHIDAFGAMKGDL